MLKHEDNRVLPSQAAAQVRVTPEELAAAITRLEARNDACQRNMDGTVTIGEVVAQLGIDATPEEVLAEVQAGRVQAETRGKRLTPKQRLKILLGIGAAIIGLVILDVSQTVPVQPETANPLPTSIYAIPASYVPVHIIADPNLLVGDTSGKIVMLSEAGDNQLIYCTFDNSTGPMLTRYSPDSQTAWRLIKHDGKIYVRGWMVKASPKVTAAFGTDVSSLKNSGFIVPVTLSLDNFVVTPDMGSSVEFHASAIHLDKHAYEKW